MDAVPYLERRIVGEGGDDGEVDLHVLTRGCAGLERQISNRCTIVRHLVITQMGTARRCRADKDEGRVGEQAGMRFYELVISLYVLSSPCAMRAYTS